MTTNKTNTFGTLKKYFFTPLVILLSIALNFTGSKTASHFAFPLYMDSVATIGCAALCGVWPSLIVAVVSNFLLSHFSTTALPFMLCHITTSFFASLIFDWTRKNNEGCLIIESFLWAELVTAFSNSALGDTFSLILFYGNTSIPQVDNAVQGIFVAKESIPFATYWGGTVTNLIDKIVGALFGFAIYFLLNRRKLCFADFSSNKKNHQQCIQYKISIFTSVAKHVQIQFKFLLTGL